MSCPNINLEEWKLLVASRGEDVAYALWDLHDGNVPESESKSEIVKSGLKATNILQSPKADQFFNAVAKNKISGDFFWKKMQADLGIPKDQMEILKSFDTQDKGELISSLLANYSFAIEINTAKGNKYEKPVGAIYNNEDGWQPEDFEEIIDDDNTSYYSNLTVPGGTNYTENEIATPAITPSIKGHAQFATDQGIGWFRSDELDLNSTSTLDVDKVKEEFNKNVGGNENEFWDWVEKNYPQKPSDKTRRILEVQSDLFQKGRDKEDLVFGEIQSSPTFYEEENQYEPDWYAEEYNYKVSTGEIKPNQEQVKANQFLQLLNQGSNWVTFFVKSIIQDSSKKGYEKVLFPSGDTASKVEGHTTLKEFKKQKEDRIKQLEKEIGDGKEWVVEIENNQTIFTGKGDNFYFDTEKEALDFADTKEKVYDVGRSFYKEKKEINQLKQELERVEGPEGFGALKPIFNFYENTVKNILNKQYGKENVKEITDEYGNTWNEVTIVAEREQAPILLQTEEMPASKASEETVNKIKELAKQAGINIQDLVDYAKANPAVDTKNINGLADIVKGIIAIAQGREGTTLTEEYVHIASAIVEKTNPQLITALISKIARFKIYNITLEAYKNNKAYQLPNGKPDIRKIKKEAVDKLISELIIKQSEGSTEFPELMEEETRSMLREWWNAILDAIKGIYTKSNVELFETAAEQIAAGELGGVVSDINTEGGGVFFQQTKSNPIVDAAYELQKDIHDRMILIPEVKDAQGNITTKRHYEIDGEIIEESVTEKHQSSKQFKAKTPLEISNNDVKMKFGIDGHDFIENEIKLNLIDSNGYAKENFTNDVVDTELPTSIQVALRAFARELIRSYEPGTRFLIESMVVNSEVKGKLGSTVDFKAFEPIEVDGEPDMRVDTLDWKFSSLGSDKDDVAWWNVEKWPLQMGEYIKMDRNLGITTKQTRKARMVPFVPAFEYETPGVPSSGLVIKSLEVGSVDPKKETKLYLVPVPVATETTGSKKLDALVTAFRNQYDKLRISSFGKTTDEKNEFLNQLSKAIRQLQVQLNFEPLATIGQQFLNNSARALKAFETIDYNSLSANDIQDKLGELLQFKDSAIKFATIDEDYLSVYNKKDLDAEGKNTLALLRNISDRTGGMLKLIKELEHDYAVHLAIKSGVISEEDDPKILKNKVDNFLKAEVEITGLAKTFLEGTKLSNRVINLASNLILKAKSLSAITIGKAIDSFGPLVIKLEAEAKRLGKTAFEMIGEVKDGKLKLIKKLDQSFYNQRSEAIELENKEFFLDNMNLDEYKRLAEEKIKSKTEIIKNTLYSTDQKQNELEIQKKLKILNDSLNINDDSFNGYNTFDFKQLFMKSLKEEKFYSDKFKQLQKSDAALQVWNTFTDWNIKAYEMGYLDEEGLSFFPLMEATLIQKLSNNSDIIGEGKDFFDSLYKVRVNEESQFSKLDPETRKLKKIIPKYFTRTDRAVHQLSTDLTKVGALYMKAVIDYQTARNLENTLLILHSVEQSKGTIVTDESGIVFEGGDPVVDETAHKSADILMTIADDALYGHAEDLNSLGNSIVSSTVNRTGGTQEQKANREVNLKKALQTSNIFIRALAVGLKPLLAAANYMGFNFQAYINAGNLYRYDKDFKGDHVRIISGNLSIVEKALMHYISGLNEDVAEERIRSISRKQSLPKWLGTWTFSDAMMSTNSIPEKALGLTNVLSMLKNSIVIDGKILNIRQYLKEQDRKTKYKASESERTALEKSFEARVLELKNSDKTLISIAKIENDELVIPGISDEQIAELRVKIIENGRKLNGQMNRDDKAGFARDTIFRSFMMFKTWIPKQILVRGMNMKRSNELNEWELGRTRAFLNVWSHLGTKRIFEMSEIINGSEKGLAIMDAILKEKKEDYFRRTGQQLEISQEEFYDLMRQELTNQMKELKLLFGLMTLVLAVGAAQPPEDADPLTKNHYKYLMKATHKISDELSFYYNPTSFESMTKGSILPQLGLATKVITLVNALGKEGYATAMGDDKTADKTYPLKYAFNLVPVAYQLQTDILPLVYPEGAKRMGVRVSPQARQ